jgi:lia operon protein LiaF
MSRYLVGILLILAGLFALLHVVTGFPYIVHWWPAMLTVFGVAVLASSLRRLQWFGIAVGIWVGGVGIIDILHANNLTELTGRDVWGSGWALVLVALGLSLIFRPRHLFRAKFKIHSDTKWIGDLRYGQGFWTLDKDLNLDHGIGDVRLDLSTATITDGIHEISVHSWIGDCVIRVPDNVSLRVDAGVMIGNVEVLSDRRDGITVALTKNFVAPDSMVELVLHVHQGIGDIRVIQVPAAGPRLNMA